MKRTYLVVILFLILVFVPTQNYNAKNTANVLNNKTLSFDRAIKDGNIIMISYSDTISSKTHNDMEIYNISRLDDFMKNVNKEKRDKIRIVKYVKDISGIWVNKLYDLKYERKKITYIEYDVYSDPNAFIPSQPLICNKIIKQDYSDGVSYRICSPEDINNNCASLISFNKSSIVDGKN